MADTQPKYFDIVKRVGAMATKYRPAHLTDGIVSLCTQPFQEVPITDAGVDTAAFLEACEDLVKLFGEASTREGRAQASSHLHSLLIASLSQ